TDPDPDPLTYSATGLPAGATLTSGGAFNWTPSFSQAGLYSVTFTVSDGSLTDSKSITITVNNVDQAPVVTAIGAKTVAEAATLAFTVTATDPDGDTVTLAASGLPAGATFD